MNKISLYTLLILIFLGLSKSLSPSAQKAIYIQNEKVYSGLFQGAPLSLILVDMFQAGFLIKTYYMKFKIVHGFKQSETIITRTSKKYWTANKDKIGMSLFRRYERDNRESVVPMPPGTLYIGDPAFGGWKFRNSGKREWYFHRAYRHFPFQFFWDDFRPTYEFYEKLQIYLKNEKPFFGLNQEFGTKGSITSHLNENSPYKREDQEYIFLEHLSDYIDVPPWKKVTQESEE